MKSTFVLAIFLLLFSGSSIASSAQENFAVGFERVDVVDFSRVYDNVRGRVIKTGVWFPLEKQPGEDKRLTLAHYICAEVGNYPDSCDSLADWEATFDAFSGNEDTEAANWVSALVGAYRGKLPKTLDRAIAIYGIGGEGSYFDNAPLMEALARQGVIVIAIESTGPNSKNLSNSPAGFESQARDFEFALGHFTRRLAISSDKAKILLGWSLGGLSAILAQSQNSDIDAVVSLDGSISLHSEKVTALPQFSYDYLDVPYLFFSADRTLLQLQEEAAKIRYASYSIIHRSEWEHIDFGFYRYYAGLPGSAASPGYQRIVDLTTAFVTAVINHEGPRSSFSFQPELNLLSALHIQNFEGQPAPMRGYQFIAYLFKNGGEAAQRKWREARKTNPDYKILNPEDIVNTAYILALDMDRLKDGISLLEIMRDEEPVGFHPIYHLGRLYERDGQLENALAEFEHALELLTTDSAYIERERALPYYQRAVKRVKRKISER